MTPTETNGHWRPDELDLQLVERVAHLAADLLDAARELGDGTIIASAELSAHRAGTLLAKAIRAQEGSL